MRLWGRSAAFVVAIVIMLAVPISAHTFNHSGRDQVCEADLPPDHATDDGHAHFHHVAAGAAHWHGGVFHEAGHTHSAHNHDPCKQIGMDRPEWPDAAALTRTFTDQVVIGGPDVPPTIITDFEAYVTGVQDFADADNLIIVGDDMADAYAAADGMPGSGTRDDPYIIEGRLIRNALLIKDTSRCFEIRDNVVHSRALVGPLIDPDEIIHIPAYVQIIEIEIEQTETDLDAARAEGLDDEIARLEALLEEQQERKVAYEEKLVAGSYEALGVVAATLDALAQDVEQLLRDQLAPRAGRMILDWNGQCIHVYNNIIEDLRVNQNNARTGYATGGLIEDNQIYHIGQIRHYDGEFRDNTVGYVEHLRGWLPGDETAPLASWVAMNTDGFNQGWFHDNTFYGSVDLDFHGHHHGAGFFAPESHYHGSDPFTAYMMAPDGTCLAPAHDHGMDDPLLDLTILEPHEHRCLPHHNHQLRWTSAVFEDNLIVDPFGYGLRYEDRNHQGDDRYANSEDMIELDAPHFHRSHIRVADNTVLGSIWVDIFNSPTVDVWSDDYSEVRRDLAGMILGAAQHLGAEVLPSHPQRNDGWFELSGNTVFLYDKEANTRGFHYGWAAYQLNHVFEAEAVDFVGNEAHFVAAEVDSALTAADVLAGLRGAQDAAPEANQAMAAAWAGARGDPPISYGLVIHHLENSTMDVCGNTLLGFDAAVLAWQGIYDDATLTICDDNLVDAESFVRTTAKPTPRATALADGVRGLTEDSSLEPLGQHIATPIGQWETNVMNQEAWISAWLDNQMNNAQGIVARQLDSVNGFMATQAAWAEGRIHAQLYWADYQAAQRLDWAEYQLAFAGDQADFRAAQAMGHAEWGQAMAEQYAEAVPI